MRIVCGMQQQQQQQHEGVVGLLARHFCKFFAWVQFANAAGSLTMAGRIGSQLPLFALLLYLCVCVLTERELLLVLQVQWMLPELEKGKSKELSELFVKPTPPYKI